jgi:serine/threonine protein kinase
MSCNLASQGVTLKSDMYSFGMVLWEVSRLPDEHRCFSGALPHPNDSQQPGFLCMQIITSKTPASRGKLPTPDTPSACPADVWDLIQQCLMLKPEDRPSAKQVAHHHHSAQGSAARHRCHQHLEGASYLVLTWKWSLGPVRML